MIKLYENVEYEFILYDYTAESKVLTLAFLMLWLFILIALILILNYYSRVIDWLDLYLTVQMNHENVSVWRPDGQIRKHFELLHS